MSLSRPNKPTALVLCFLIATVTLPLPPIHAAEHVVSRIELEEAVTAASEERSHNIEMVQSYLRSLPADALPPAMDSQKIEKAIAFLSDEELTRLAERVDELSADARGAGLSKGQIWLIVIAGSVALLILTIIAYNSVETYYY